MALGAGLAVWLRPRPEPVAPGPGPAPATDITPTPERISTPAPTAAALESEPAAVPAVAPVAGAPALLNGEAAHEAITDLAVTYEAAAVPALARYLAHSDPEIRSAARDGLVQLGERAAIPFLEAAAKTAADAEEARSLREAAEFLALPTWTEQRDKRLKPATP
jgi:HEAT repeat protein